MLTGYDIIPCPWMVGEKVAVLVDDARLYVSPAFYSLCQSETGDALVNLVESLRVVRIHTPRRGAITLSQRSVDVAPRS